MTDRSPDVAAIVPAAGHGERLGLGPKAFLKLGDTTLLERVVSVLEPCVSRVVVGVPSDQVERARALLGKRAQVIAGGETRQATVQRLFAQTSEAIVILHDASRPFASRELVLRVIAAARSGGAAVAMTHPPIPVARVRDGGIEAYLDRQQVMLPQTPQAYRRELLARAMEHAAANGIDTQATWQLLCCAGIPVQVVVGEEHNIKITSEQDWAVARDVLWPRLK